MAIAFRVFAINGVAVVDDTCMKVTVEGSTMRTLIGYGMAFIQGYWYVLKDDGGGIYAFTHGVATDLDRIDRIVLRLDLTTRTTMLVKLIGIPAAAPEVPALTRTDDTYELGLAQVYVRAGEAEVFAADVTDERGDEDICGTALPAGLKFSQLWQSMVKYTPNLDVIRYGSAMELTAGQKDQACSNAGAVRTSKINNTMTSDDDTEVLGAPVAKVLNEAKAEAGTHTVTLPTSGWAGSGPYTYAATLAAVKVDNIVMIGPTPAGKADYEDCGAYVSAQAAGSITFTAESEPATAITVNVVVIDP